MLYPEAAVERTMKRQEVICRALAGTLTWLQAADILGIDPRSLRRWRARYQADGVLGLIRSEEHTSELQSQSNIVCRLLLEKKKKTKNKHILLTNTNNKNT